MSTTLDRLRLLQSLRPQRTKPDPVYVPLEDDALPPPDPTETMGATEATGDPRPARHGRLEDLVTGAEATTPYGPCFVVTEAFPLAALRGNRALGDLLRQAPAALAAWHPEFALDASEDFADAVFLDTETTGLGNGAGVYAFMIGVGVFERWDAASAAHQRGAYWTGEPGPAGPSLGADAPTHFVVRQFFMRHPGEEPAVLAAVADLVAGRRLIVTFNGRSFDAPLLRARYLQNRRQLGPYAQVPLLDAAAPHLDLLMPARRLWRRRLQSCRLVNLEQMILGLRRSEADVPGALIPYLYLDYVRSGNGGEVSRIFYHNREDIVSMVSLAQRLIQAYTEPEAAEATLEVQAEDWLALGQGYARCGDCARAEWAYRRALDVIADQAHRARTFAELADLLKRQNRWDDAAAVWELWLTSIPGVDPTPYVELAKCCEWQLQDLERAEMWTAWALHNLTSAPHYQRRPGQVEELEKRLARIKKKRGG